MKTKNTVLTSLVLSMMVALPAGASSPELIPPATATTIVVTPANLDKLLNAENVDVTKSMNQVLRAKDQVNQAMASLIPSLNINFISTIANPPAFLINFASCLVPFLFPANWYHLNTASKSYMSDVTGLEITRLNTYAVAYNVLVKVKGDGEMLKIVEQSVNGLDEYVKGLEVQSNIGLMPHADVLRGQVELGRISSDLSRLRETIAEEYAAVRKMLGFNMDQKFELDAGDDSASQYENQAATNLLLSKMYQRAPERTQLEFLHQAAESGVSEARWAFLGGCTGNSTSIGPGGTSAFTVSTGLSISIGYGYFPTVSIAKRNVRDVEIRQQEMQLELGRQLETVLADIAGEKARLVTAEQAETAAQALLSEQNYLLDLGRVTVRERLDAITALGRARIEVVSARTTLAGHRLTLKRLALENRFLEVLVTANRELELKHLIHRSGD